MNEKQYAAVEHFFKRHPHGKSAFIAANKVGTGLVFVLYPVLLVVLALNRRGRSLCYDIVIPGSSFLLLSWYRGMKNRKRPYEKMNIRPVIKKETAGKSFPSRHVFSSFLIAVLWLPVSLAVGTLLLVVSALLSVIRVVGGVHYVRDVAAGAVFGIAAGTVSVLKGTVR